MLPPRDGRFLSSPRRMQRGEQAGARTSPRPHMDARHPICTAAMATVLWRVPLAGLFRFTGTSHSPSARMIMTVRR